MAKRAGETVAIGPGYDPVRVQARVKAVLDDAPQGRVVRTALQAFRQGMREHDDGIAFGESKGSSAPPREQTLKRGFQWVCVAPDGDSAYAWTCRFPDNSTLGRLHRKGSINNNHLVAAERFAAIHNAYIEEPKVTGSYQPSMGGARGPAEWLTGSVDAGEKWRQLCCCMAREELDLLVDIAVKDKSIAELAAHLKPAWGRDRARKFVIDQLTHGLERIIDAA